MGLFDHLFKPKPEAGGEKGGEVPAGRPEDAATPGKSDAPQVDPSTFLLPKGYGAGVTEDPVAPVQPAGARPVERKSGAVSSQEEPAREVVLTLNDILPRIPTHYLSTGMHDLRRELRFDIDALSSDIARGRASVPLSSIAALCPQIFHSPIGPLEDMDIRLPLQKVVDQIGRLRADSGTPSPRSETPGEPHEIDGPDEAQAPEPPVEDATTSAAAKVDADAKTAPAPPAPHSFAEEPMAQARIQPFSATTSATAEIQTVETPKLEEVAPASEPASVPSAEAEPAPTFAVATPDTAAAIFPAPTTETPAASSLETSSAAATAPAPEATPAAPVQLPRVRLFAPPPPMFAAIAPAALETAVSPVSPASAKPDTTRPSAESELLGATEPAPNPPAPRPVQLGEAAQVAAFAPAFSAPTHVKSEATAEIPRPILRSTNLNPAPASAGRPLILPPPLRFGQPAPEPGVAAISPPPAVSSTQAPELKPPVAQVSSVPASASEPKLAPPASFTSAGQDNIQALFMTDEVLDLQKISRLAAELPGVQACVIATRETAVTGGLLPEGFDVTALLGLAPRVGEAAGRLPIGALKHFTLYGERYSVSFFERSGLCLCAVHRARSFVPGVREKLVALADELAG